MKSSKSLPTSQNQKPAAETPSIAIIGTGYWGINLVRNLSQLGALTLICDNDQGKLTKINKQYPDIQTCLKINDVFKKNDIDGVVIATPAETHYSISRKALLSGKHVFVEKPLALNMDEANELISIAEKGNQILMVGHLLRYHPAFIRLKQLVQDGELGKINYICSHRLNLGKIRSEENILWSFAPHDISMILSLADEEPESIQATGGNYLHKQIADVTTTHIDFPSGLKAHIFVSWLHPFKEQKLVVVGDKKMAVFDDTLKWEDKLLLYPHQINWKNNAPVPIKGDPERVDIVHSEPLRSECEHFLDCITNNKLPLTDGNEGLRVLKILNASQNSLDNRGSKINLSSSSPVASAYYAHETAIIDEGCEIGKETKIWHFSHILSNSKIGKNCNIGQNVVVGPDVTIGNRCKIQNNVSVYKGVTLEDGVFCGPSIVFTNIYNPRAKIRKMDQVRPTLIKNGTTIGANATIVCGITLGRYSFIGAGALVNKNVPDYAIVVGNPAKQIGWACECGERISDDLVCPACKKKYTESENGLKLYE